MIETKEKTIEGSTYSVTQLPARRAIKMKARLIKLFGPVFAQVMIAFTESDESNKKNQFVKALEILSGSIDENSFESIVMELLNGVRKNGMELSPSVIDIEFAGDLVALYEVVWFVIEVNFSNFFQLMGIGSQLPAVAQPVSQDTKKTYMRN